MMTETLMNSEKELCAHTTLGLSVGVYEGAVVNGPVECPDNVDKAFAVISLAGFHCSTVVIDKDNTSITVRWMELLPLIVILAGLNCHHKNGVVGSLDFFRTRQRQPNQRMSFIVPNVPSRRIGD